jgi:hypothetical protein
MTAWERESGELPAPNLPPSGRKTGRRLIVFFYNTKSLSATCLAENQQARRADGLAVFFHGGKIKTKRKLLDGAVVAAPG